MIREIINFTKDLIDDIPDIMQWKTELSKGIHVVVEIDSNGYWINADTSCYIYSGDDTILPIPVSTLIRYEQLCARIGTNMNKVLDKKKQIFSCSPYSISFKKKSLSNDKIDGLGKEKITRLLPDYFSNAQSVCLNGDERLIQLSKAFQTNCDRVLNYLVDNKFTEKIKDEEYISLYLKNATDEEYLSAHSTYLRDKLFNCNDYNKEYDSKEYGLSNFLNGLNSKKPFLEHKTAINKIAKRISSADAKTLSDFEELLIKRVLPNPIPIVIDNRELNKKIVKLFNKTNDPISYREVLIQLFNKGKISNISDYYLIMYTKRKSIILNDVDFVPLFRFYFDFPVIINNVCQKKEKRKDELEITPAITISNIFDFERIVVKIIFNNSLVKIKEDKYTTNYFGDIDPRYVSGGDPIYLLMMKYRKAFYDYIYKSKVNAITDSMFNDIIFQSILSNIQRDEVAGRFSWNNSIKEKINIWFSLNNFFSNNIQNNKDMASKVTELFSKMSAVAKGEAHLETPEEFAFGAGQLVSYLIDRSVASNKTYAMLEPFLQKSKTGQLQDAITQYITVYKHDISAYKGPFQKLSSDVLTYDDTLEVKPLLKYFLAGCFYDCVVYQKKETSNDK